MFIGITSLIIISVMLCAAIFLTYSFARFDAYDKGFNAGIRYLGNVSTARTLSVEKAKETVKEKKSLPSYIRVIK